MNEKNLFYFQKEEPIRACLLALRSIILEQDLRIRETRKYGMPCFCLERKPLCYLWTAKKTGEPYLLFVDGNLLDHPKLEKGDRKKMKILQLNSTLDLPKGLIQELLHAAILVKK